MESLKFSSSKNFSGQESEEEKHSLQQLADEQSTLMPVAACEQADKKEPVQLSSIESGEPSETTMDTARTEESVEGTAVHLYDPYSNGNEPLTDIDDEELISALRYLQVDEDSDEPFDFFTSQHDGVLDELELDPEEQELLPLEDFANVFGDENEDALENNIASLEDNLNRMSVSEGQEEMEEHGDENGEIPWYLLCRPCEPGMEDPLSIQMRQFQALSEEEKLQLSLLTMADNNHILDGGAENEYSEDQQVYEDSFQSFIVSRRREAVEAAISYTRAFGTGLYQPAIENENPTNERTCFGHKETIYCVSFSECGRYLASASQDATVCIWEASTNSLLSTLTGHNKEFECLRVAW